MRAQRARRAVGRGACMAVGAAVALTTASMLALCLPVDAQEASDVGALSGTLKRVKQAGTITLGHRASSLPFSHVNRLRQPIGYSIDLCREIVDDVSNELDGMDIRIGFAPVTPANRLQKVVAGEVDLECGSATANTERREQVAFSPIFFIAGTKLRCRKPRLCAPTAISQARPRS